MWLQNGYNYQVTLAFPLWRWYYNDDERRKPPKVADYHKLIARTLKTEQTLPETIPCWRSAAFSAPRQEETRRCGGGRYRDRGEHQQQQTAPAKRGAKKRRKDHERKFYQNHRKHRN